MIDYKIFNVTDLATNCVYLIDKETGCNAVVDPGAKSDKLIEQITQTVENSPMFCLLTVIMTT